MKKILALLIMLSLAFTLALADTANALTLEEIEAFNKNVLQRAIEDKLSLQKTDEGYLANGNGYELLIKEDKLDDKATVLSAAINGEIPSTKPLTGPRDTSLRNTADEIIEHFQSDNENLKGTINLAALYIEGNLPDEVRTGTVMRNGQSLLLIEYSIIKQVNGKYQQIGIDYTIENGGVVSIRSFTGPEMTKQEAEAIISELSMLQEKNEYFSYDTKNPKELVREDLSFAGVDFVDLTRKELKERFGEPIEIDEVQDSDGSKLETYNYDEFKATFTIDKDGNEQADSLVITGYMEGPRGLKAGEILSFAMKRFPNKAETLNEDRVLLYGDKDKTDVPTGLLLNEGQLQRLYFTVPVKDKTVAVEAKFISEELVEISLMYVDK